MDQNCAIRGGHSFVGKKDLQETWRLTRNWKCGCSWCTAQPSSSWFRVLSASCHLADVCL